MIYLREWRQKLNLKQNKLARLSGVTQPEISNIENGRVSPTLKTFQKLVESLNLRTADLFENPTENLDLTRHEIDELAKCIISGDLPDDKAKASLAKDMAGLISQKLTALNRPGKVLAKGSRWNTISRYSQTRRKYSDRTVKQILARVDKLI